MMNTKLVGVERWLLFKCIKDHIRSFESEMRYKNIMSSSPYDTIYLSEDYYSSSTYWKSRKKESYE